MGFKDIADNPNMVEVWLNREKEAEEQIVSGFLK